MAPNGTVGKVQLVRGNATVYPIGLLHWQFNPSCNTTTTTAITLLKPDPQTYNIVQTMGKLPKAYVQSAFADDLPGDEGLWVLDRACAKRCGISASNTTNTTVPVFASGR